ncbi:Auxin response factor [Abeliophyllum distichum]|uniref:Auxin response factor n=1 Tax=Abeliophyllum distichum TaxID=126358 RepID=A0ABD1V6P1_9LAMI
MKKNQNRTLCHSNSFGKETDPVFFTSRETFQLNTYREDKGSMDIEAKAIDELWNGKLVEKISKDDENESGDSLTMEDQKRFSNNDHEGTTDPLASDVKGRENLPNSPELESSLKYEDFVHGNENESKNSAVSDLFETDKNVYTDKNITECELPELVISCKDVNYHIVKDICVDDGIPIEETILIESNKDDSAGVNVCLPSRRCETTEGDLDSELLIPDGLTGRSPRYMGSVEEKLKTGGLVGGTHNLFEEMKLLKEMQDHSGTRKPINSERWHACAGPLVTLPQVGSLVYYFPQGHSEQQGPAEAPYEPSKGPIIFMIPSQDPWGASSPMYHPIGGLQGFMPVMTNGPHDIPVKSRR